MVRFDLASVHPKFVRQIEDTYASLMDLYPRCQLKRVESYTPKPDDRSMGHTEGGVISFNLYWFGRDPKYLVKAAKEMPVVSVNGMEMPWHLPLWEPVHVLHHEFYHALSDAVPGSGKWSKASWTLATANPGIAPTGYALANPDEFWAEAGTAYEFGYANAALSREMERMLKKHRSAVS